MRLKLIVFTAVISLSAFCTCYSQKSEMEVIAYYTGDAETLEKYPIAKLTHIIYSFLHLSGDTLAFSSPKQEKTLLQIAGLKKKYPNLKVMVSLGGWGGCEKCSPVFAEAQSRKNFAASTVKIFKRYNVDGIDLDWEYPTIEGFPGHPYTPEDKQNFTELVKELRSQMGSKYELSFAAGGFQTFLTTSVDWKAIMPLINRVNLMTYDLVNGYSKTTGHHTALFSRPEQVESTDNCVQYLLKQGLPSRKLVIGAAFYARVWQNVPDTANGLYQAGDFLRGVDYKAFGKFLSTEAGWIRYWDDIAKAPYSYNKTLKQFATYDDDKSLAEKVDYARKYQLGGIMFWELMNDTFSNGRLNAIYKALE
ncbi:MAG: glycoside hydrolase family 18 protein [Bacteroidota bacterium]